MDFCESKMFNSNRSNLLKLGGGSTVSPAAACHRPCRGTDEVGCGTSSVATSFFFESLWVQLKPDHSLEMSLKVVEYMNS